MSMVHHLSALGSTPFPTSASRSGGVAWRVAVWKVLVIRFEEALQAPFDTPCLHPYGQGPRVLYPDEGPEPEHARGS